MGCLEVASNRYSVTVYGLPRSGIKGVPEVQIGTPGGNGFGHNRQCHRIRPKGGSITIGDFFFNIE